MAFYIKEWPNNTATLMSENGSILWTFRNVQEAQRVCQEWYQIQDGDVFYCLEEELGMGQGGFDPACASCAVG